MDISYNYKTLKYLPDELMQIPESPNFWDTLIVSFDYGAVMAMENISDSLKAWIAKHSKAY